APTAAGLWRGASDPPGAARILLAALVGVMGAAFLQERPAAVRRPLLALLVAAAPLIPLFTGRGLYLLAFQGPMLALVAAAALAGTDLPGPRAGPRRAPAPGLCPGRLPGRASVDVGPRRAHRPHRVPSGARVDGSRGCGPGRLGGLRLHASVRVLRGRVVP